MSECYDRQGKPIDLMTWARLHEDESYMRVARERVGRYDVSTVWLGLNHNYGGGPPLTFETMIFDTGDVREAFGHTFHESVECWRYPTEEAALAGHDQAVAWAREAVSNGG